MNLFNVYQLTALVYKRHLPDAYSTIKTLLPVQRSLTEHYKFHSNSVLALTDLIHSNTVYHHEKTIIITMYHFTQYNIFKILGFKVTFVP
jgi:hypothetical protein